MKKEIKKQTKDSVILVFSSYCLVPKLGFTLIELLIAIAILGIMAGVVMINFISPPQRARDARRMSNIRSFQASLEVYANNNNGLYPLAQAAPVSGTVLCTALGLTNCPTDPKPDVANGFEYRYQTDATGTKYVLWVRLERPATSAATNIVYCSDGKAGTAAYFTAAAGGVCPSLTQL